MRHTGLVLALLAAATQLPACATTGNPDELRGRSGAVTWEIVDIRQRLEANGSLMRWDFIVVFKNTGGLPFDFERVEVGSRPGGSVDAIIGGMETVPFAQRLEPDGELRIQQSQSWGCSQCAPGHLPRFLGDGVIAYYTFLGHDSAGGAVRVPIAVRLNSSVGTRQ